MRKLHKYGKRGNFGYLQTNFWANKNFPELAYYVSLKYLSTTNFKQNMKKSNEAVLRKLHKYGKRGNLGYFRSNLRANKNFPKLVRYVSMKYLLTLNFM